MPDARPCAVCSTPTKKKCTGCAKEPYCSSKCQKEDWVAHILECGNPGREVTSADRLMLDIKKKQIPFERYTREHYGFNLVPIDLPSQRSYSVFIQKWSPNST
ncbi:hypothetical protein SISSUDRAFT_586686 [Sistotremastrum suecicum HHB10207 ss-3]|uniref:MYND-type domain-containing protein n=1 Tax=Sistotremastrum suecicum HHB10207 ss-3 TaxID=1314776 RepID=A0A165XD41_9AGAM|nr:hypothetical protein SISSUDRAFT_586686 [Sistotremastrum suecicum HHB10207 ss-3]